jgi:predicted transposase/invertase (TIGR01784 family)
MYIFFYYEKYVRWFRFAEKSRNIDNKKEDFDGFLDDKIFEEMIDRLCQDALEEQDFEYITDYETFREENKRYHDGIRREALLDGREEGLEEGREEGREEGDYKRKVKVAEKCLLKKMSIEETMEISELSFEEVTAIAQRLSKQN